MCGHTLDPIIHSKFHRNPFRGFGAPGGQNLAFPLLWLVAFTTACTTVQAVMKKLRQCHTVYMPNVYILHHIPRSVFLHSRAVVSSPCVNNIVRTFAVSLAAKGFWCVNLLDLSVQTVSLLTPTCLRLPVFIFPHDISKTEQLRSLNLTQKRSTMSPGNLCCGRKVKGQGYESQSPASVFALLWVLASSCSCISWPRKCWRKNKS